MIVDVLRRRWSLEFAKLSGDIDGECDSPYTKKKRIRIDKTLVGRDLLETIIHEVLHAACWPLREDMVTEYSHDVAAILWKLGYRREGECESES